MSQASRDREQRIRRERALYVYSRALEEGDFETMARVHEMAEEDPLLEQQIEELEALDAASFPELAFAQDTELVRRLLARHLPSGNPGAEEDPPPLTVGDVVGKLLLDRKVPHEDQEASAQLRDHPGQVPARLGLPDVRRFGSSLGVRASERFWQLFRETALLLGLSHSRQVGFAAARRKQKKDKP